ncbi:MAG: hypothetical protein ACXAEU_11110 [Candidatus Hodarchaeales archaeon]|jgi:hypothetical protein
MSNLFTGHQNQMKIECPCSAEISSFKDFRLLFIPEKNRVNIFCSNDACFLKVIGQVELLLKKNPEKLEFKRAEFHSPFVSWNKLRNDETIPILKDYLRKIVIKRLKSNLRENE